MSADFYNKNAEKWTEEIVRTHLLNILTSIKKEPVALFFEAVVREGLSVRVWRFWKKKFQEHEEISEYMALIESMCMVTLFNGALEHRYKAPVAMFALKYNHRWHDKLQEEERIPDPNEGVWIVLDEERRYKIG